MKVKVSNSEMQAEIKELDLTSAFVKENACLIGRSHNSGLVLDSPDVSRLHGKFFRQEGQYYFSDLGSSNGSTINGDVAAANQSYLLKDGDVIRVGEFVLIVEATSEVPEEIPETVIGGIDATVISGWRSPTKVEPPESKVPEAVSQATGQVNQASDEASKPELESEVSDQVVEAELVNEVPGALVKVEVTGDQANDPQNQTKALFAAINSRALAEVKAAGSITREAYLNAVRKAREAIEHNKFIDPDQIEKEAEKYWQSVAKGTSTLGSRLGSAAVKGASEAGARLASATAKGASEASARLGSAAKAAWRAAWKEIAAPRSDSQSKLNQLNAEVVTQAPEGNLGEFAPDQPNAEVVSNPERVTQVPEGNLGEFAPENKLNQADLEGELSQSEPENKPQE